MKKILIADKSKTFLDLLHTWLVDAGYLVLRARDLKDLVLATTPRTDFDLVLIGDLGQGTKVVAETLADLGHYTIATMWRDGTTLPGLPQIPLPPAGQRPNKEQFLKKVEQLVKSTERIANGSN